MLRIRLLFLLASLRNLLIVRFSFWSKQTREQRTLESVKHSNL